jgi:hypothetical protein
MYWNQVAEYLVNRKKDLNKREQRDEAQREVKVRQQMNDPCAIDQRSAATHPISSSLLVAIEGGSIGGARGRVYKSKDGICEAAERRRDPGRALR